MTAHPDKLMRAHIVGKKNVILDRDVPGERNFVSKDIIVADHTVVRDVYSNHKKVPRPDARRLSFAIGPVKRTELADDIVVADLEKTRFTLELYILRPPADNRMLEDAISGAQPREAFDDRIRSNRAIRAD